MANYRRGRAGRSRKNYNKKRGRSKRASKLVTLPRGGYRL